MGLIAATKKRLPHSIQQRIEEVLLPYRPPARAWICALIPLDSSGAEVGVWRGDFTWVLLQLAAPKRMYLADPWVYQSSADFDEALYGSGGIQSQQGMDEIAQDVRRRFGSEIESGQVEVMHQTSLDAAATLVAGTLDWVYIDGNHLYEEISQDLDAWAPLVREGGFIFCDDYGEPGWWDDGVTRAADEFADRPDWERFGALHGQVAFRRHRSRNGQGGGGRVGAAP